MINIIPLVAQATLYHHIEGRKGSDLPVKTRLHPWNAVSWLDNALECTSLYAAI